MNKKYFGIVYAAVNKINGKIYVGQTIQNLKADLDHIYTTNSVREIENEFLTVYKEKNMQKIL